MQEDQYEFFAPFAHIPNRYECCRIHAPSHGSFDVFIVIETQTHEPVTVYVNDDAGVAFMASRYPESQCIRVAPEHLTLESQQKGCQVEGYLKAQEGPIQEAHLVFQCTHESALKAVPYGNKGFSVWGSQWSCTGVDMEQEAQVTGFVQTPQGKEEFHQSSAIITQGSFGHIQSLQK
ncbi:MAG: hypothetical protein MI717_08165 [Spirochaetales bacterium]|nr:hypothetical protein [Spirochaetales bacterium]